MPQAGTVSRAALIPLGVVVAVFGAAHIPSGLATHGERR